MSEHRLQFTQQLHLKFLNRRNLLNTLTPGIPTTSTTTKSMSEATAYPQAHCFINALHQLQIHLVNISGYINIELVHMGTVGPADELCYLDFLA